MYEIKYFDWMLQVTWLFLTNHSALFLCMFFSFESTQFYKNYFRKRSGTGIKMHNLLIISILPWPQGQGSRYDV